MTTKPVKVSIRVGEDKDSSSSDSSNSDSDSSTSDSDNNGAPDSTSSGSESYTDTSDSESSAESANSDADDDLLNREQLLDKLDDLQDVLEQHADEAMQRQDKHMPLPVMCEQVLDTVLAWNDTLSQCLRVMRPVDVGTGSGSDQDDSDDKDKTSSESDKDDAPAEDNDNGEECGAVQDITGALPVLISLNLDAQPIRRPDLTNEFQVARAKCEQYADAACQCATLTDSHDMLLQCQKTEERLTLDKMDNDVFTLQEALKEAVTHHEDALEAQAQEREAMAESLARCQAEMPSPRLAIETVELAAILQALPDWVPQKQLWLGQAAHPCTDREILVIAQHIIRMGTPLDAKAWKSLVSDLEAKLQKTDKMTDDIAVKMRSLEDSAGALRIPRNLVQRTRELVDTVRAQAARRGEQRAKLENDMFVIRKVHTDQIETLARSFVDTKTKLCDAASMVVSNNQNKWQLALAKLMNACVHPLLEMTMPLAEARLSPRALMAYHRLKEIGERDIDAQRLVRVEALVRHALGHLPELQRVAHEYAALKTIESDKPAVSFKTEKEEKTTTDPKAKPGKSLTQAAAKPEKSATSSSAKPEKSGSETDQKSKTEKVADPKPDSDNKPKHKEQWRAQKK